MIRWKNYLRYIKCISSKDNNDRQAAFSIITKLGNRVLPQYRFNFPEIEWWNDSDFNEYLTKFEELHGFNSNRRWMLYQLLRMTTHIDGDTAECGAFRGASSYLMLSANRKYATLPKCHHIFDSFEGLSEPSQGDGSHWAIGNLAENVENLVDNLSPFTIKKDYELYKGWIPDRFLEVKDKRFSFVHVDVDLYQPTLESFSFFYPRLKKGGILLCDDYGFDTCPGARKAADEFFLGKDEKMIELPDGGGFLIKGQLVAN